MSESRFIVVKDPHLQLGFQVRIRKNYEDDIRTKLQFISSYMLDRGIRHIVFTGDVFDNQKERTWLFTQVRKNLNILREYFTDKGLEIHSVAGNHDFFNGRETIENTVYGEAVELGIINHLPIKPLKLDNLMIYGINYSSDLSKVDDQLRRINNIEGPKAVVLHQNVTPQEAIFTDYTYDFLKNAYSNIHMWICGHYHVGFDQFVYNNKVFINPWNLTRVARDYPVKMDQFKVQIVDVNLNSTDGKMSITPVTVPHKKFTDAFVEEFVNILDYSKRDQFEFFNSIDINSVIGVDDDQSILEQLASSNKISKEAKQLALSYLNGDQRS